MGADRGTPSLDSGFELVHSSQEGGQSSWYPEASRLVAAVVTAQVIPKLFPQIKGGSTCILASTTEIVATVAKPQLYPCLFIKHCERSILIGTGRSYQRFHRYIMCLIFYYFVALYIQDPFTISKCFMLLVLCSDMHSGSQFEELDLHSLEIVLPVD